MRHRVPWLGITIAFGIASGACDHKPAPKKKAEPATAAAPAATPTPTPAPAPPQAPAPAQAPSEDPAQACMQVGVRVADVFVASATSPTQRAQYEQARADTVRATAQACMRGNWDASLRQCFLAATTQPQIDACNARAPGPAASRPTRGS